ncbi:hypothetical protein RYX36_031559, partial [Vicia faba]
MYRKNLSFIALQNTFVSSSNLKSILEHLNDTHRGRDGKISDRSLGRSIPQTLAGEEEHIGASACALESIGFSGGPYDTSLLVRYEHHIALRLWFDERGPKKELKVVGHGLKLIQKVPVGLPPEMEGWMSKPGLSSLQRT